MKVLGLHCNVRESGVALLKDGRLVHVVSQERLDRRRGSSAAPIAAIDAALRSVNWSPEDLDFVAVSDDLGEAGYRKSRQALKSAELRETFWRAPRYFGFRTCALLQYYQRRLFTSTHTAARRQARLDKALTHLRTLGFSGEVRAYEHSHSHACGAYFCSGMDPCLIFVNETVSFGGAGSIYEGRDGVLTKLLDIPWPHSPGRFCETLAVMLGLHGPDRMNTLAAMAAYGDARLCGQYAKELFRLSPDHDDFLTHPILHLWRWDYRTHQPGRPLPKPLRAYRPEDLAAAWQTALEDAIVGLVRRYLHRNPRFRQIAVTGDIHGNAWLNQRINDLPDLEELYVHPGMSDCGQPVGTALACWAEQSADPKPFRQDTSYLGPEPEVHDLQILIDEYHLRFEKVDSLPAAVAELLANGKTVGLCRGQLEYGHRALGNRSILRAGNLPDAGEDLARQLGRQSHLPFAPLLRDDDATRCFHGPPKSTFSAGFMTVCYDATEEMKQAHPAVVHRDGKARPQILTLQQNPFLYKVLGHFTERTGQHCLLNTSFRLNEEPLVCSARDALRTFVLGGLDALVLRDHLLLRENNPALQDAMMQLHA